MAFSISGNFFCLFKTGDNVLYNITTLNYLYEVYEAANPISRRKLLKPIIVIEVAIIEAILHDFHFRIRVNVIEGISGLGTDIVNYVRGKKIDELEAYISSAKKHDFFSEVNSNFYDKLDELRKIRNRIHIQNTKRYKPLNEYSVFTEAAKISAEKCLEKVVKTISTNHPRPENLQGFVGELNFPWDEYF